MKSKFILSGGGGFLSSVSDVEFYRSIAGAFDDKDDLKVCSVPYASLYPGNKPASNAKESNRMSNNLLRLLQWVNPHKYFSGFDAPANVDDTLAQMREADIIFAHGGNGDSLQEALRPIRRQMSAVIENDKVCAGFSAGCNMWVNCYYSNDNRAVCDGMNFIPIKTFCHYAWQKFNALNELILTKPELPVFPLTNDAHIVYSMEE
jgi:peptidase E